MPRFAANCSMLFTERPMLERPAAAARAGFGAVEVQFPYAWPVDAWARALRDAALPLVLLNLPAGDWAAGERGLACNPARRAEFREGVAQATDYARALGVRQLNCLSGLAPPGLGDDEARATFVDNLRFAARQLAAHGLRLLIEPINRFDMPGFWLHRTDQALAVMDAVGADNLMLQFDLYHAQRTEGGLMETLTRHIERIGHVQVADHPGRHEPGTGSMPCKTLFAGLDRLGYPGWVGAEYHPLAVTEAGLGWLQSRAA